MRAARQPLAACVCKLRVSEPLQKAARMRRNKGLVSVAARCGCA